MRSKMFFTVMRAERKLSTPPGMFGRFTLMSTAEYRHDGGQAVETRDQASAAYQ